MPTAAVAVRGQAPMLIERGASTALGTLRVSQAKANVFLVLTGPFTTTNTRAVTSAMIEKRTSTDTRMKPGSVVVGPLVVTGTTDIMMRQKP